MTTCLSATTRRAALGLIGATFLTPRAALAAGLEVQSGTAFGTTWRLAGGQGSGLAAFRPGIEAVLAEVDRQFSPWRADSALSAFNASVGGVEETEADLLTVTRAALGIARVSEGAFDPTVGPLVARWGFGPIHAGGAPDWRGIRAGATGLGKTRADLTLDLCGIAKGWALDRVAALLRDSGAGAFLFELGGEFIALGDHPDGRAWRVAVEHPLAGQPPPVALRLPGGMAAATSGLAVQSYLLDGRLYGHIIDPAAGVPATGALGSVTVAAPDAMTADGWATALFAAGAEDGPEMARAAGLAALFLSVEGGSLRRVVTGPMAELIL